MSDSRINRLVPESNIEEVRRKARKLPAIELTRRERLDLERLAVGGYAPLQGFLREEDYRSVLAEGRLADGTPWTVPVTLSAPPGLKRGRYAALRWEGRTVGIVEVESLYDSFVGGTISLLERTQDRREDLTMACTAR